jgi:hypothetical protein
MIKSARVKFDKLVHDTGRAILIRVSTGEHWIPKSVCRKLTVNNKLGGHVCLPPFIIEKLGINIDELQPDIEIIHHIPTEIKTEINHDSALFR